MKNGRSLMELAQELERQRNAKRDYLLDTLFHGFFLRGFQVSSIIDKIADFVNFFAVINANCYKKRAQGRF